MKNSHSPSDRMVFNAQSSIVNEEVMPITLKISLVTTDMLFIFYWLMAGFSVLGIIAIPVEMMSAEYNEPRVGAIS